MNPDRKSMMVQNLNRLSIPAKEHDALQAIAAIIENQPFNTLELNLGNIPEGNAEPRLYDVIEALWKKPPGFREALWDRELKGWLPAKYQEAVTGARAFYRM